MNNYIVTTVTLMDVISTAVDRWVQTLLLIILSDRLRAVTAKCFHGALRFPAQG